MTAGEVILVPFRELCVSPLIFFIYEKYGLHLCEIKVSQEEFLVPIRGENKSRFWYLLGVACKLSDEHPRQLYKGVPRG